MKNKTDGVQTGGQKVRLRENNGILLTNSKSNQSIKRKPDVV
jgi:hypothetical protein